MTFPSRKTGTPRRAKNELASCDAKNCNGRVIWLKMIFGMGTMRKRKAQGKSTARNHAHPTKVRIRPASNNRSDVRERNSSAPRTPMMSVAAAPAITTGPNQDGAMGRPAKRLRVRQSTYAENKGTKNPWEKSGSCHHCAKRF